MKKFVQLYLFVFLFTLMPVSTAQFASKNAYYAQVSREYSVTFAGFIRATNRSISVNDAIGIARRVVQYSTEFDLNPFTMLALVATESTFKVNARSKYGAQGLTQVVPRFHREKIDSAKRRFGTSDLSNPDVSLYVGAWVLREYMDSFKGNTTKALAKYKGASNDPSRRLVKRVFSFQYAAQAFHERYASQAPMDQFINIML